MTLSRRDVVIFMNVLGWVLKNIRSLNEPMFQKLKTEKMEGDMENICKKVSLIFKNAAQSIFYLEETGYAIIQGLNDFAGLNRDLLKQVSAQVPEYVTVIRDSFLQFINRFVGDESNRAMYHHIDFVKLLPWLESIEFTRKEMRALEFLDNMRQSLEAGNVSVARFGYVCLKCIEFDSDQIEMMYYCVYFIVEAMLRGQLALGSRGAPEKQVSDELYKMKKLLINTYEYFSVWQLRE